MSDQNIIFRDQKRFCFFSEAQTMHPIYTFVFDTLMLFLMERRLDRCVFSQVTENSIKLLWKLNDRPTKSYFTIPLYMKFGEFQEPQTLSSELSDQLLI